MIKSYNTSILSMLYGFVLITAVISMLEAAVFAYMHYGLENGYMIRRFTYYIPCFAIIIYGITALFLVIIANRNLVRNRPFKLPKFTLFLLIIIAIGFQYYTERVSDWHLSVLFDDLSKTEYMSSVNFGRLFEVVEYTTLILRWFFIVMALLFFSYKLQPSSQNE